MGDIRNTVAFKALVAQTEAELLTRGLEVVPVAVHNVLAYLVTTVAEFRGVQPRSALRHIDAAEVADRIAEAAALGTEGAEAAHGVRPVRVDGRRVDLPRWEGSRPLMALTQVIKYASGNDDKRTVQHAADLALEIAAEMGADPDGDMVHVPAAVLDEVVALIDHVADRIETHGWSLCPCGEEHGQREVDAMIPGVLRGDAELVRTMRARADD